VEDERFEQGMPALDRQAVRVPIAPSGRVSPQPSVAGLPPGSLRPAAPPGHGGLPPGDAGLPPSLAGLLPRSVPETKPTPLQKHYVLVSAPALVLGAVAITALELGVPLGSPLIKLCVLVAAPLLAVANADAIVRIWRSAWAWMPVDRSKGLFRLAWVVVAVILYALLLGAAWLVLTA
jgi:hypothetical protein